MAEFFGFKSAISETPPELGEGGSFNSICYTLINIGDTGDQCVVVKVKSGKDIKAARVVRDESNPYIELSVHPADGRYGRQSQKTSYKPTTLDPSWSPYERFQFFSSVPEETRVIFSMQENPFLHITLYTYIILFRNTAIINPPLEKTTYHSEMPHFSSAICLNQDPSR
jgi:hypothetical protein